MTKDSAAAVVARWCQAMNCALEAVEGVRLAVHHDDNIGRRRPQARQYRTAQAANSLCYLSVQETDGHARHFGSLQDRARCVVGGVIDEEHFRVDPFEA